MDLLLLIVPSLLFVLLQQRGDAHRRNIRAIREGLEAFMRELAIDEIMRIPEVRVVSHLQARVDKMQVNIDRVRTAKAKEISESWFWWALAVYLFLFSAAYFLLTLDWSGDKQAFWGLVGSWLKAEMRFHTFFASYTLALVVAMFCQILSMWREKNKVVEASTDARSELELLADAAAILKSSRRE